MTDTEPVEMTCPFCGGTVRFDPIMCAAMHGVPWCAEFQNAEDSLAFVTAVRKASWGEAAHTSPLEVFMKPRKP